jgi:DNA uptake protein ComE-like DNA-binding protein
MIRNRSIRALHLRAASTASRPASAVVTSILGRTWRRSQADDSSRTGSVLILVLVVVVLLSYSAYSFSELMIAEYAATSALGDQIRTRALAESGIDALAAAFDDSKGDDQSPGADGKQRFRHQPVDDNGHSVGRYSIVQRLPSFGDQAVTFGPVDESSKLNLNALPLDNHRRTQSRNRLLALPGMTEAIADAILDWMDEDDEPSEFGAESAWYSTLSPPRLPAQRRMNVLSELLLVRGVTHELLYGEDRNQNGRLDPNENDGARSEPSDNADGKLDRGWSDLITLHSREAGQPAGGSSRINVNRADLSELFDDLESSLGEEAARFIVAWRLAGSAFGSDSQRIGSVSAGTSSEGLAAKRRQRRMESAHDRLRRQLGRDGSSSVDDSEQSESNAEVPTENEVVKGGINLSRKPAYTIRSVFDLIGTTVRIDVDRRDTVLKSPWAGDPGNVEQAITLLQSRLATTDDEFIAGRINVNEASPAVLRSVPGIDESLAESIHAGQRRARANSEISRRHETIAWLFVEGLVDLRQLRSLAPWLTTRGDVFSGISIGHIDGHRVTSTIEFLIDSSGEAATILQLADHEPSALPVHSW